MKEATASIIKHFEGMQDPRTGNAKQATNMISSSRNLGVQSRCLRFVRAIIALT
jgi:hypothetical protein